MEEHKSNRNLRGTCKILWIQAKRAYELAKTLHVTEDRAWAILYRLESKYGCGHSILHLIQCAVFDIVAQEAEREIKHMRKAR